MSEPGPLSKNTQHPLLITQPCLSSASACLFAGFDLDELRAGHDHLATGQVFFGGAFDRELAGCLKVEAVEFDVEVIGRDPGEHAAAVIQGTAVASIPPRP